MNKKNIIKFVAIFILSFIAIEIIESIILSYYNINLHALEWGWLGFIIIYGLKFHIFCCIIPAIWVSYKCRHKKCKHDYCDKDKK